MTDEQRRIIRRLVDEYIPYFEAGAAPSLKEGNFFKRMIEQAENDGIIDDDYVIGLERLGGWSALKDLELIAQAGIDEVRVLLTAAFRVGEYRGDYNTFERDWSELAQAGTFTAILHRLDKLERESHR